GLGVFCIAFGKSLLLLPAQSQAQLVGDFPGDILLHPENIGKLPLILLAPEVMIVASIDQFGADKEIFAMLNNPTDKDRLNFQFASDRLGLRRPPFVTENGGARDYGEVGHLSEAVDEAFGDAVAQVLEVGIPIDIDER